MTLIEREVAIVDVVSGKNVKIVHPVNLYGCTIGDDTFIGPFVEIQKNVSIGRKCKIQSHSFICEFVTIGDSVFIGHGVMFINDTFSSGGPAGGNKDLWKSTNIGNKSRRHSQRGHPSLMHKVHMKPAQHTSVLLMKAGFLLE